MKRDPTLPLLGLALLLAGCTRGEAAAPAQPKPAGESRTAPSGTLPRLVFFMNPNGSPCQMQDRVLQEMAGELKGKVEVVRYRTTESADLDQFREFGIRSLPSLVLTDAAGHELRRATPGIQAADAVRRLLAP